jgi:hypothetical protein
VERGGVLQGGTLNAANGATLDFAGGVYSVTATIAGSGAGQVRATGATFTPNISATLNFPNGGFAMLAGSFEGFGSMTLQGNFVLSGASSKSIQGLTLNNEGTLRLEGTGDILGGGGAIFNNRSGATFHFASAARYLGFHLGEGGTTFTNSGTVRKSEEEVAMLSALLTNQAGIFEVEAGALELERGGNVQGGTFTVAESALLDFTENTYLFSGTVSGAGAGFVRVSGATIMPDGDATFTLSGGGFAMTQGELQGPGALTFQGPVTFSESGSKSIVNITINNEGRWLWIGPGSILGGQGAIFNNLLGATFEARTVDETGINYYGHHVGGDTTFNNNGAVIKSGDGASATLDLCYTGIPPVGVTVEDSCP